MNDTLEQKFRQAEESVGGGYVRVGSESPFDLFVGAENGRRAVLLLCEHSSELPARFESFELRQGLREDGRWALTIALADRALGLLFCRLAGDLIEASSGASSGDEARALLLDRLLWWHRLLSRARSGLLDANVLRGLVAELHILLHVLIPAAGEAAGVEAWRGPFDAPRDFVLPGQEIEVKAIRRQSDRFRVSSAAQLETQEPVPLHLALVELDSAGPETPGAFSVSHLVSDIRSRCTERGDALQSFNASLTLTGYSDDSAYDSKWFHVTGVQWYECRDDFPRITRSDLPTGIEGCEYEVLLSAIAEFHASDWSLGLALSTR